MATQKDQKTWRKSGYYSYLRGTSLALISNLGYFEGLFSCGSKMLSYI